MIRWWPQDILWFDRKICRPTGSLPVGCAIRVLVLFPLSFEFEFGRIGRARKAGAMQYTNVLVDLVECVDAQEFTEPGSATRAMVGGHPQLPTLNTHMLVLAGFNESLVAADLVRFDLDIQSDFLRSTGSANCRALTGNKEPASL
jgi:hypothetical protein